MDKNAANDGVISAAASRVAVRVIRTDAEQMIARAVCHVYGLLLEKEQDHKKGVWKEQHDASIRRQRLGLRMLSFTGFTGRLSDSGEGRWRPSTRACVHCFNNPVLFERVASHGDANRLLSR